MDWLAVTGSCLSFVGGGIASYDAFTVRSRTQQETGASHLQKILEASGKPDALKDEKGNSLASEKALHLWFAERSLKWTWVGFGLMTLGFLFELLAQLLGKS